jgi:hypothetical protein
MLGELLTGVILGSSILGKVPMFLNELSVVYAHLGRDKDARSSLDKYTKGRH